jgi:glycosyltransferase involved in cell wall biosynthesis
VTNSTNEIGVVVIGRNEGERLKRCLQSVISQVECIVYVDSGSSDGSVEYAESLKVDVVRLDMKIPFSAGRARNEGFQRLSENNKTVKYFQFIDGDCDMCGGWLSFASVYLENNKYCAVVAGRRCEKFPKSTVYNLLCDIEWNTPVGETESCGGDFMIRKEAFRQVNGFNPAVIAGEEPEMCYRLRKKNWLIVRLNHSMTLHDAAITRFSQWWTRAVRSGHAYAHEYALHAHDGQGYCFKESAKSWFWALVFPMAVFVLGLTFHVIFFWLYMAYFIQFAKISLNTFRRLGNVKHSMVYSIFTVIAKWPQFIGQLIFLKRKMSQSGFSIIEYN